MFDMQKQEKIFYVIGIYMVLFTAYIFYTQLFIFENFKLSWFLNWSVWSLVLPNLLGFVSAAIFLLSKFKTSRPLQIYFCYIIFNFPFFLISFWGRFTYLQSHEDLSQGFFIFGILLTVILMVFSCMGLWMLTRQNKPLLQQIELGGETFSEFAPASSGLRFSNRLIDMLIVVLVLLSNIFQNIFFREYFRGTGDFELYLLEFATSFIYYMMLESVFKITIGKCITNTMVVNEQGETPSFINMTGRTLCRFIPFEALSFLGSDKRGWHDSMSGTYVVKRNS